MIKYKEKQRHVENHRSKFTVQSFLSVIMETDHKLSKKAGETTMQRGIAQKYLDSHTT